MEHLLRFSYFSFPSFSFPFSRANYATLAITRASGRTRVSLDFAVSSSPNTLGDTRSAILSLSLSFKNEVCSIRDSLFRAEMLGNAAEETPG